MTDNSLREEDFKLIIFGWITTVLGIPEKADPTKYNELTDRLYDLFTKELSTRVAEAQKIQAKTTGNWIEDHIKMLHKDLGFKKANSNVAFTYAEDQARQGRYKSIATNKNGEG
jgi:hypothetical protein